MNAPRARILYLIDELDLGGTEQQLLELLRGLDRSRLEPLVACFRDCGRIAQEIDALGVSVTLIRKRRAVDLGFLFRLIRFIRGSRPQIVQTFLFTANTWGRIAAWICRVPILIASERNVDTWKGPGRRWVDRRLARMTTCLVTNAGAIKQFLVEEERVAHADIRVIYNGVRWERFETLPAVTRPEGRCVIGIVGRLEPQKDHRTCLEAFARLQSVMPNVTLRVVGDGSLRHELEQQAAALGVLDHVEFVGTTRDLATVLSGLDLLVVSSTREGCANVILEAMVAGIPVVATTVGGNPELIEDGVSGLLVPARQPDALANAVHRVLDDHALAQALAHHARERVAERFSVDVMVQAYDQLYERLLHPPVTVCYVIDDLGDGGAQRQLVTLASRLPRDRFAPHVISLSTKKLRLVQAFGEAGIPITMISQPGRWGWSALWRLYRLFRRLRPQVVHTWLFTADLYGRLAARLAGVPKVVTSVRSPDLDKPRHHVWADRWLSRMTDVITINVEAERDVLCARERIAPARLRTIHNGVDTDELHPALRDGLARRQWQTPPEAFVIGLIGRLSIEKNPLLFLHAAARIAARVPHVYFWVLGEGPLQQAVEEASRSLELAGRVRLLGYQSDIQHALAAIDLIVVPSQYEGCANVILEAMALGKPVVATHVGGNPELVIEGFTGLLVPPNDVDALADAIERLATDRAAAVRLGQAGRERALGHFSVSQMVDAYTRLYEELCRVSVIGG